MKMHLDGILVVEGKEDASYLSNYISSEIVTINGFEMPEITISYLKNKRVIILTDPDKAGIEIRKKLNILLPNSVNVEIDAKYCTRGIKKGVAECNIQELLTKLKTFATQEKKTESDISVSDLYNLGLMNDKELRTSICQKLNLGKCNSKTLYKRLLNNNVSLKQLCEIMNK